MVATDGAILHHFRALFAENEMIARHQDYLAQSVVAYKATLVHHFASGCELAKPAEISDSSTHDKGGQWYPKEVLVLIID